jgi:hypothetical protein
LSFPPGRRDPPRLPQPSSTFGPARPTPPPSSTVADRWAPLSSLTLRRAGVGLWESWPRTPALPPRRGSHANRCARPYLAACLGPTRPSRARDVLLPALRRRQGTRRPSHRRHRFDASGDLRAEPAPPGAPGRRAAPPQPLPVVGPTPERGHHVGPESAALSSVVGRDFSRPFTRRRR